MTSPGPTGHHDEERLNDALGFILELVEWKTVKGKYDGRTRYANAFAPDMTLTDQLPTLQQLMRRRHHWQLCVRLSKLLGRDKAAGILAAEQARITCVEATNGAVEFAQWQLARERVKAGWRARIFDTPIVLARFERRC